MSKAANIVNISLIILQNVKKEVLLLYRPENVDCPSCWSFPGGKLKKKESYLQAAQRELYEETHATATQWHSMANFHHKYPKGDFFFQLFHAQMHKKQVIQGQETHFWFPIEQLHTLNMPKANQQFLEEIYQLE